MGHANMTPTRPPRGTEEPHSRSAADGVSAYSWMSRRSSHSGRGVRATRSCHRGVACRRAALRSYMQTATTIVPKACGGEI